MACGSRHDTPTNNTISRSTNCRHRPRFVTFPQYQSVKLQDFSPTEAILLQQPALLKGSGAHIKLAASTIAFGSRSDVNFMSPSVKAASTLLPNQSSILMHAGIVLICECLHE